MIDALKNLASFLPARAQQEIRRAKTLLDVHRGRHQSYEPEYHRLAELVKPSDWVLDIGANVGYYTLRMSELVGAFGRVVAFEPVPQTVEVLASVVARSPHCNVTIINAAVGASAGVVAMAMPDEISGLPNYFTARVESDAAQSVLQVSIDSMCFPHRVTLAKIDVEGYELQVVRGMAGLIVRDHPTLIIENPCAELRTYLHSLEYKSSQADGSPNTVFVHGGA